jgi:hypothetical protein
MLCALRFALSAHRIDYVRIYLVINTMIHIIGIKPKLIPVVLPHPPREIYAESYIFRFFSARGLQIYKCADAYYGRYGGSKF